MVHDEIKSLIEAAFSWGSDFTFLRSRRNNNLCIADKQELDGAEVIDLAGYGTIYLHLSKSTSTI